MGAFSAFLLFKPALRYLIQYFFDYLKGSQGTQKVDDPK